MTFPLFSGLKKFVTTKKESDFKFFEQKCILGDSKQLLD